MPAIHRAADEPVQHRCNAIVPEMHDESFGTLIEVTNGVPIAAERSMYWDAQGVFWSGGTNATGMRLP